MEPREPRTHLTPYVCEEVAQAFRRVALRAMVETDTSRIELARKLGCDPFELAQVLAGTRRLSVATLIGMGYFLGIPIRPYLIPAREPVPYRTPDDWQAEFRSIRIWSLAVGGVAAALSGACQLALLALDLAYLTPAAFPTGVGIGIATVYVGERTRRWIRRWRGRQHDDGQEPDAASPTEATSGHADSPTN